MLRFLINLFWRSGGGEFWNKSLWVIVLESRYGVLVASIKEAQCKKKGLSGGKILWLLLRVARRKVGLSIKKKVVGDRKETLF